MENWEGVLADVDTLKSGSCMGQSCMNWYLLRHWLERKGTTKVIYLNHRFISRMQHQDPLDDEEHWMILQSLGFQRSGEIPRLPVAMFVYFQHHYFVAVFDYDMEHITLYGWFWNKEGIHTRRRKMTPGMVVSCTKMWQGCFNSGS